MNNSKFLKLYKLVMEQVTDFPIKEKCYAVLNEINQLKNVDDFFSIGQAQLAKDNYDISKYRVICSGKDVIKLVKNKTTTGSGNYKAKESDIKLSKISANPYINAIFYVLNNQKIKDLKNNIPFTIFTPENAGEKEQKETAQIENIKTQLEFNPKIKDGDGISRGPFDKVSKTPGNKPKSDATISSSENSEEKLYVSLKSSDGKPPQPGAFNQYGGVSDLGGADNILKSSQFINNCYEQVKNLFLKLKLTDFDFQSLNKFIENFRKKENISDDIKKKITSTFAFKIPEDSIEKELAFLEKTKFGSKYGTTNNKKDSSPENVDLILDGEPILNNGEIHGSLHTEWNPSLYKDSSEKIDEYRPCIAFAPQLKTGGFKDFKHCRFNIFPEGSRRVKIYFERTNFTLNYFLNNEI